MVELSHEEQCRRRGKKVMEMQQRLRARTSSSSHASSGPSITGVPGRGSQASRPSETGVQGAGAFGYMVQLDPQATSEEATYFRASTASTHDSMPKLEMHPSNSL